MMTNENGLGDSCQPSVASNQKEKQLADNGVESHFFRASAEDFKKIPGSPIAYWVSDRFREAFLVGAPLDSIAPARLGMTSSDNNRFVRYWNEISSNTIGMNCSSMEDSISSGMKWFPYNKGGDFRRWFGNNLSVINWQNGGKEVLDYAAMLYGSPTRTIRNIGYFFWESITWSFISSSSFGVRSNGPGFIFDVGGSSSFPPKKEKFYILSLLASKLSFEFLKSVNPTLNFQAGNIGSIPVIDVQQSEKTIINNNAIRAVSLSKEDWDSYEISWDFTNQPLLKIGFFFTKLLTTYQNLRAYWQTLTLEMLRLEEENNSIFIEAYGLQGELTATVPLREITLTCNPHYRYGGEKCDDELEMQLLADTMREFISYAVGCMVGRYSLDAPGLILANQGEGLDDYHRIVREKRNQLSAVSNQIENTDNCPLSTDNSQLNTDNSPTFEPDTDNVIPMLDGDWFTDDISERFRKFLRITFGEEHYEENLTFIEQAIGKDIRKYFLKDFYTDHVKRYKKRPIYWLFSSPKGSFNALIYMHRYRPDTVSVVLNDYLREFRTKLTSRKNHLDAVSISGNSSQAEKTKALKEIEALKKIIVELETWEREVLYPLATKQVEIDLDDGVKVNYLKFGAALKKITGMDAKED